METATERVRREIREERRRRREELEFGLLVLVFILILGNWWFGAPGVWGSGPTKLDVYVHPGERTTLYLGVLLSLAWEAGRIIRSGRR